MSTKFLKYNEIDMSSWSFKKNPPQQGSAFSTAFVNQPGQKPVQFQIAGKTDPAKVPFGISPPHPSNPDSAKLVMKTIVGSEVAAFGRDLDDFIKRAAMNNSKEWFKKSMTDIDIERAYQSPFEFADSGTDENFMKIKVHKSENPDIVKICRPNPDESGKWVAAGIADVVPQSKIMVAVRFRSVWFGGGRFGPTMDACNIYIVEVGRVKVPAPCNFYFGDGVVGCHVSEYTPGVDMETETNDSNKRPRDDDTTDDNEKKVARVVGCHVSEYTPGVDMETETDDSNKRPRDDDTTDDNEKKVARVE